MYYDFYGFLEPPFNITPDPRFLFFSAQHREAFNHLLFGLRERKGFIQITGEIGAGKTTLCRALLKQLDDAAYRTALVLNPKMNNTQLLRTILRELGLPADGADRVTLLERLNRFLLAEFEAGRDVVLIVDDAQALTLGALEQIRLLSNLETDQRKLLQIVLIGQPELRAKLARLEQLRQRITVRYHLRPLKLDETAYYIQHRLNVAGSPRPPLFSRWAVRTVQSYSRGVPRLINAVCDKALLCGYVYQTHELGVRHVRRAIRELEGEVA
ncbi:MAG: AAA family ATPase [Acidobacteriota bacterium]|nr:AAA family ATPase [Acidobacteriota bacterium]MDH3522172.1 AAA family ATPase [Acidobacteriota bacterium]